MDMFTSTLRLNVSKDQSLVLRI